MAGPTGPPGPPGPSSGMKQTGTRPKSRGSQNSSFSSPGVQSQGHLNQGFMMGMVGQHDNRQVVGHHDNVRQGQQEPNMANLMREHQTVSENLAMLREQLEREAVQPSVNNDRPVVGNKVVTGDIRGLNNVNSQPRNQRQVDSELINTKRQMVSKLAELEQRKMQMDRVLAGRGREAGVSYRQQVFGHSNGVEDVRGREIELLRSRLRELEDMVMVLDRPVENTLDVSHMFETRSAGNNQFDLGHSFNNVEQNHSFGSLDSTPVTTSYLGTCHGHGLESDSQETLERSLALLTAQYEKTSHEEDRLDLSPGMLLDKSGDKSEHEMMPPAMVPLNNSESVRLARELRDKRDQLEQLMQKNVFTTNVNELTIPKPDMFNSGAMSGHNTTLGRSKDTNRSHGVMGDGGGGYPGYVPHRHPDTHPDMRVPTNTHSQETNPSHPPTTYTDLSWMSAQSQQPSVQSNSTSQQLYRLQDQVTKLKGELDRLSLPHLPQSQPRPEQVATNQLAQLSASINQLYSGLWAMQRDVSNLTERMLVLERAGEERPESRETIPSPATVDDNTELWPGNNTMNNNIWPGNTLPESDDWPGLGSTQQPNNPFPLWEGHQHFSPFPSRDLWNSLQASPGFSNPLHPSMGMFGPNFHISETDSGVSSGALNNQVSPGMRANNYYDNFRSFSRQNRLSGPPAPTPSLPANSRPTQRPTQQPATEAANNLPSLSNPSTRPRRKYKINREQNRDRGTEQSNVRRRTEGGEVRGANPVLAANTYTSPNSAATTTTTGVDSLTKNIYSQVGALIQQNDRAPELLARLLQDLTLLGQQDREREGQGHSFRSRNTAANMNLDTVDTSSYTSEDTRDARHDQTRSSVRPSRSKVSGKRLTSGPQSVFPVIVSNSAFDPEQSSSDTPLGPAVGLEGGAGSGGGGEGWGQTAPVQPWNITPPQLEQASGVAVPKNQQKNLISRERDSRKMPGWRERLLPRNMQGGDGNSIMADQDRFGRDVVVSMPGQDRAGILPDQDGFVNIQLELPTDQQQAQEGHNMSLHHSLSDMAEAELAEADQVHEAAEGVDGGQYRMEEHFMSPTHDHSSYHPEGVFPVRDSDSPLRPVNHQSLAGLDRVPIRLPSTSSNPWPGPLPAPCQLELDRLERRLVEEEAVASIVEEVLASSPELANNHGADMPPTP